MSVKKKEQLIKGAKISESYVSMGLGLLVVIVVGIMIFNFLKGRKSKLTLEGIQTPTDQQETIEKTPSPLETKHSVVWGESLWTIAQRYYNSGYDWVKIAQANNLTNPDLIKVGQELNIPQREIAGNQRPVSLTALGPTIKGNNYTVARGDSLWKIAVRAYGDGYQWVKIAQANNLANPDLIHAGNVFKIPR